MDALRRLRAHLLQRRPLHAAGHRQLLSFAAKGPYPRAIPQPPRKGRPAHVLSGAKAASRVQTAEGGALLGTPLTRAYGAEDWKGRRETVQPGCIRSSVLYYKGVRGQCDCVCISCCFVKHRRTLLCPRVSVALTSVPTQSVSSVICLCICVVILLRTLL